MHAGALRPARIPVPASRDARYGHPTPRTSRIRKRIARPDARRARRRTAGRPGAGASTFLDALFKVHLIGGRLPGAGRCVIALDAGRIRETGGSASGISRDSAHPEVHLGVFSRGVSAGDSRVGALSIGPLGAAAHGLRVGVPATWTARRRQLDTNSRNDSRDNSPFRKALTTFCGMTVRPSCSSVSPCSGE